jgi:hypothetical protein
VGWSTFHGDSENRSADRYTDDAVSSMISRGAGGVTGIQATDSGLPAMKALERESRDDEFDAKTWWSPSVPAASQSDGAWFAVTALAGRGALFAFFGFAQLPQPNICSRCNTQPKRAASSNLTEALRRSQ